MEGLLSTGPIPSILSENTILEGPSSQNPLTLLLPGNFALWNQPYVGQNPFKFSL